MSIFRVSPYVQALALDGNAAMVGHPFFLEYAVLENEALLIFNALRAREQSLDSLRESLPLPPETLDRALKFFRTRHFVLADGEDEDAQIKQQVAQSRESKLAHRAVVGGVRNFRDYAALNLDVLKSRIPTEHTRNIRVVILGGCLSQYAANAIEQLAPSYGINATVEANWPDRLDSMPFDGIDVVVFQPFIVWMMAPFWDGAPFLSEEERERRVAMMKEYLQDTLQKVLPRVKGRLLLVQGVSTPTHSPFGAAEFRQVHSFRRVVHELNDVIVDAVRNNPDVAFIDEEHLMSNVGKLQLIDDSIALASHHGPIDSALGAEPVGPSRKETFGFAEANQAPRLFAKAYLDAFVRWSGIGRIKCVIVDLDNTLWPGVAGEEGFDLTANDVRTALWTGVFAGIHQALKIVKQQGVLLAIASRQNELDVDKAWEQLETFARDDEMRHLLSREDFVVRKINWGRKSASIAEILDTLGVAPDAALFLDDNAAERAEAQEVFPKLRVLGENMHLIRGTLLSDPCLQKDVQTSESQSRTEMVKAQLQRDSVRKQAGDGQAFLRGLDIKLRITRVQSMERLGTRLMELIQRTNQFNTTLLRPNGYELLDLINLPQGAVYTLDVTDRFASYGLVGACLIWNDEITHFVMSCRVIPLSAAVPFLSSVLTNYGHAPIRGSIVEGPRNQPCRSLFKDAGFDEVENGSYVLSDLAHVVAVDPSIYHVEFHDADSPAAQPSVTSNPARKQASQPAYTFGED
jgi:FkbH-like protein